MKQRTHIQTARELGFSDAVVGIRELIWQLNNSINPTEEWQTEPVPEQESVIPILVKVTELQSELLRMEKDYSLWRNRAKKGLQK